MRPCFFYFRVNKTFLLHHDSCWTREHCGHCISQHSPWPQRRHPYLPYKVHFVRDLLIQADTLDQANWCLFWFILFQLNNQRLFAFRSDASSDFEIDIEVYCLVSKSKPFGAKMHKYSWLHHYKGTINLLFHHLCRQTTDLYSWFCSGAETWCVQWQEEKTQQVKGKATLLQPLQTS